MSVDVTGDVIVLICIVVVDVINVFQHLVLHSVTIPVSMETNVSALVKTAETYADRVGTLCTTDSSSLVARHRSGQGATKITQ